MIMQLDPEKYWAMMETDRADVVEMHVLSAIMADSKDFALAHSNGLREHHFTISGMRYIFSVAERQFKNRGYIDTAGVMSEIDEKGAWPKAGGPSFFSELMSLKFNRPALMDNVYRLIEARQYQEIYDSWWDVNREVFQPDDMTKHERIAKFKELAQEVLYSFDAAESTVYDANRFAAAVEDVLRDAIEGKQPDFQRTGIASLDNRTGGLPKSRVTIFAARTSHGKTAFSMWLAKKQNMAWRRAKESGQVLYFSAEMGVRAMGTRVLSSMSGVNSRSISSGKLTPIDKMDAEKNIGRLRDEIRISVDTNSSPTTAYMMSTALSLHAIEPVKLVVFDYLEYTGEQARSKDLRLEKAMVGCHELAKRLDCPVVVLSQINREADKRGGKPQLADLRYSGSIEQVAGMVAILYHPWIHWKQKSEMGEEPDQMAYEVSIPKNTNGPIGDFFLSFDRATTSFTDPEEHAYLSIVA